MTAIQQNIYFDVLDDIVDKYNNTVHRTINMKPIQVTDDYYAEHNEIPNKKDHKFKVGDNVRISKYKNIFAKGYTPNWSEEVFVINKIKNTVPWTYAISHLNGEEITESFYEKEFQKNTNSVNPLYLMINEMIGHVKKKHEIKYLVLDDIDENKEVLNKYEEVWKGIKKEIEIINGGKKIEYGKDF